MKLQLDEIVLHGLLQMFVGKRDLFAILLFDIPESERALAGRML